MFNVSTLLLDDALKPAMPLTNVAISETLRQSLEISHGSVATHVRCGGIFIDSFYYKFSDSDNEIISKIG